MGLINKYSAYWKLTVNLFWHKYVTNVIGIGTRGAGVAIAPPLLGNTTGIIHIITHQTLYQWYNIAYIISGIVIFIITLTIKIIFLATPSFMEFLIVGFSFEATSILTNRH